MISLWNEPAAVSVPESVFFEEAVCTRSQPSLVPISRGLLMAVFGRYFFLTSVVFSANENQCCRVRGESTVASSGGFCCTLVFHEGERSVSPFCFCF